MSHDGPYYDFPPDCKGVQDVIVKKDMCTPVVIFLRPRTDGMKKEFLTIH